MSDGMKCPSCGVDNPPTATACRACGESLAITFSAHPKRARDGLDDLEKSAAPWWETEWKWVAIGAIFLVGAQLLVDALVVPYISEYEMEPFFFLMIVLGMWAFVYFVGGAIVGRLSAGYTVKETVIASLIAFFLDRIVVHMGLHQPMDWVYFLVGLIIAFVVALLGASLGESLQQRAAKALAPRPRGPQQPSPAQPARR